jgi:hypothetical protein
MAVRVFFFFKFIEKAITEDNISCPFPKALKVRSKPLPLGATNKAEYGCLLSKQSRYIKGILITFA